MTELFNQRNSPLQGLEPLVARLQAECDQAGISVSSRLPDDSATFALWYRDIIAAMESEVASRDGRTPMTPDDVRLMVRCLLSAGTLAEAISLASDFCAMIHPRAGVLSLAVESDRARFQMDSLRRQPSPLSSLVDTIGLFSYLQLFSWLIAQPLQPSRIMLGCGQREDVAPLIGLFDAPVLIAQQYGFEFDAALLQRSRARNPEELAHFLEAFPCQIYGSESQPSVSDQVRSLLTGAIYQSLPLPGQETLARLLGLSLSTLRRRLRDEGSSYRQLKEACQQQAAEALLQRRATRLEDIAQQLGFSDSSSFRRAYHRWTGHSPRAHNISVIRR